MARVRLIAVAILFAVVLGGGLFLGYQIPLWLKPAGGPQFYSTATLLQRIQTLSQLVTVKYVVEKAVLVEDVKWYGESHVLLLAQGVVKAGVDLGQLTPEDLKITGKCVAIRLPMAQITDIYLDDGETRVIERETGMLRLFDKGMEQTARQHALDDIRRAARRSGILKDAQERAQAQLTALFKLLEFEKIEFTGPAGKP